MNFVSAGRDYVVIAPLIFRKQELAVSIGVSLCMDDLVMCRFALDLTAISQIIHNRSVQCRVIRS